MLAWMISTDIWGVCRGCSSVPLSRPSRPGAGIQGVPRTQHPRSGLSLPKPTGPLIPCQTDAFPISPAAGFPGRLRGASGLEQEVAPLSREKERVTWAAGRGGGCPVGGASWGAGPAGASGAAKGATSVAGRSEPRRARRGETPPYQVSALQRTRAGEGRCPPSPTLGRDGAGTGLPVTVGCLSPSRGLLGCFQLSSQDPGAQPLDSLVLEPWGSGGGGWGVGAPGYPTGRIQGNFGGEKVTCISTMEQCCQTFSFHFRPHLGNGQVA